MNEIRNDIQECEPENDAIQIVIPDQLMAKAVLPPKPLPSPDTLPKVSYRVLPEPPPHVFKTFWVHPRSYIRFPGKQNHTQTNKQAHTNTQKKTNEQTQTIT
jgi:hypothetical protein